MKIQNFSLLEGNKNFKDYKIYNDFFKKKFSAYKVLIFKQDDIIYGEFHYYNVLRYKTLISLFNFFKDATIDIRHTSVRNYLEISNISEESLKNAIVEMDMNRYNL